MVVVILFIALTFLSCSKEEISPQYEVYEELNGNWTLSDSYIIDNEGDTIPYGSSFVYTSVAFQGGVMKVTGYMGNGVMAYYFKKSKITAYKDDLIYKIYTVEKINDEDLTIRLHHDDGFFIMEFERWNIQ